MDSSRDSLLRTVAHELRLNGQIAGAVERTLAHGRHSDALVRHQLKTEMRRREYNPHQVPSRIPSWETRPYMKNLAHEDRFSDLDIPRKASKKQESHLDQIFHISDELPAHLQQEQKHDYLWTHSEDDWLRGGSKFPQVAPSGSETTIPNLIGDTEDYTAVTRQKSTASDTRKENLEPTEASMDPQDMVLFLELKKRNEQLESFLKGTKMAIEGRRSQEKLLENLAKLLSNNKGCSSRSPSAHNHQYCCDGAMSPGDPVTVPLNASVCPMACRTQPGKYHVMVLGNPSPCTSPSQPAPPPVHGAHLQAEPTCSHIRVFMKEEGSQTENLLHMSHFMGNDGNATKRMEIRFSSEVRSVGSVMPQPSYRVCKCSVAYWSTSNSATTVTEHVAKRKTRSKPRLTCAATISLVSTDEGQVHTRVKDDKSRVNHSPHSPEPKAEHLSHHRVQRVEAITADLKRACKAARKSEHHHVRISSHSLDTVHTKDTYVLSKTKEPLVIVSSGDQSKVETGQKHGDDDDDLRTKSITKIIHSPKEDLEKRASSTCKISQGHISRKSSGSVGRKKTTPSSDTEKRDSTAQVKEAMKAALDAICADSRSVDKTLVQPGILSPTSSSSSSPHSARIQETPQDGNGRRRSSKSSSKSSENSSKKAAIRPRRGEKGGKTFGIHRKESSSNGSHQEDTCPNMTPSVSNSLDTPSTVDTACLGHLGLIAKSSLSITMSKKDKNNKIRHGLKNKSNNSSSSSFSQADSKPSVKIRSAVTEHGDDKTDPFTSDYEITPAVALMVNEILRKTQGK
ncbi:unnamed protein product [Notodromas monacha]|uniref:Uncharacterized protein n=1 Tax=Notodromas monacha TaxID=399045 RepID=A0A7R9BG84_9CRUS|nr:unnamed protein product [Notodromas monacha]CAG0914717.1 unnamed protein product [Notodromas monacha]